jgi:hypothetical protein
MIRTSWVNMAGSLAVNHENVTSIRWPIGKDKVILGNLFDFGQKCRETEKAKKAKRTITFAAVASSCLFLFLPKLSINDL